MDRKSEALPGNWVYWMYNRSGPNRGWASVACKVRWLWEQMFLLETYWRISKRMVRDMEEIEQTYLRQALRARKKVAHLPPRNDIFYTTKAAKLTLTSGGVGRNPEAKVSPNAPKYEILSKEPRRPNHATTYKERERTMYLNKCEEHSHICCFKKVRSNGRHVPFQ